MHRCRHHPTASREVIDVDAGLGHTANSPVDLTADGETDDDDVVVQTNGSAWYQSQAANKPKTVKSKIVHNRDGRNREDRGHKSTITVSWVQAGNNNSRSDKRQAPSAPNHPPAKRQRVDTSDKHTPSFPVKVENDLGTINLEDDGSTSVESTSSNLNRRPKPDDYDLIHAGFDLGNPDIWEPVKYNESKLEYEVPADEPHNSQISPVHSRSQVPDLYTDTLFGGFRCTGIWDALKAPGIFRPLPKPVAWTVPSRLITRNRFNEPNIFSLSQSFKKSPGGINRIVQAGPCVGIATAATGGGTDDETGDAIDPYNRPGAATIWNGVLHQLNAHNGDESRPKQYTVNDIKFDTFNQRAVTTGKDKRLEIWAYGVDGSAPVLYQAWAFPEVPNDIAFKPGTSTYAVAEQIIHVYSSTDASNSTEQDLRVANNTRGRRGERDAVGAMTWGRGITANMLFASTEPPRTLRGGWHKGFDVMSGKAVMRLDTEEAGDAMALTQDGDTLALFTCHGGSTHRLRLYDVRNTQQKARSTVTLTPFPSAIELGEVPSAAFRDDGIYLAFGRNDNHVHVYDVRRLDRLLFDYVHDGPFKNSPGNDPFGVTSLEWVDQFTKNLSSGLVTGGSDGCVRFWDPHKSDKNEDNGTVIAETHSDIGHFSIGDRFQGEQELVVGDCAGEVYFFGTSRLNL